MGILLIKSSVLLVALYGVFWLLLRKSTFYHLNRGVLLFMVLSVCLAPLIKIPESWVDRSPEWKWSLGTLAVEDKQAAGPQASDQGEFPETDTSDASREDTASTARYGFYLKKVWPLLYILGCCFFFFRTVLELWRLSSLLRDGVHRNFGAWTMVAVNRSLPPLAFFHYIVLNPAAYSQGELDHVLKHELVHVRQWHTMDILLMEFFSALLWFHPLAWKLKRSAKLNLEFIADREVIASGGNRKTYQLDLLKFSVTQPNLQTVNHFNYSHLKTRIVMMNCKRSSRLSLWKYLTFLPVLTFLLLSFQPLSAQDKKDPMEQGDSAHGLTVEPGQNIYMKISSKLHENEVDKILSRLEEAGVDLTGTRFEYNKDGKITKGRLQVAVGNYTGSVQSSNSDGPIKEPIIFYFSRKAGDKVGISVGVPRDLSPEEQRMFKNFDGLLIGNFSAD